MVTRRREWKARRREECGSDVCSKTMLTDLPEHTDLCCQSDDFANQRKLKLNMRSSKSKNNSVNVILELKIKPFDDSFTVCQL